MALKVLGSKHCLRAGEGKVKAVRKRSGAPPQLHLSGIAIFIGCAPV